MERGTIARILTEDFSREIREHEKAKQNAEEEKQKRKAERAKKRLFNEAQKVSKEEERIKKHVIVLPGYHIQIPVYGDCLPTTTSYYMRANADHHVEASVGVSVVVAAHEDDNFLAKGFNDCISRSTPYATLSDFYQPGTNLASSEI